MLGVRCPSLTDIAAALPKEKPPITEIAAMPFPASMVAMRRFYNKDWHKPEADGETPSKWSVEIVYSRREEDIFSADVEAITKEDAIAEAEAQFEKAYGFDPDVKVEEITAEFVEFAEERAAA
jgi:hypothetical protein